MRFVYAVLVLLGCCSSTYAQSHLYLTDRGTGQIIRANIDGSNTVTVSNVPASPRGITVDETNRHIYWVDSGLDCVCRIDLDGGNFTTLVAGLDLPVGIALDLTNNHIYWSDFGTDRIERADLNGANVTTIVANVLNARDIAIGVNSGKMYWSDFDAAKVRRANLDGSSAEDLVTSGLTSVWGVALDLQNSMLYWSDHVPGELHRGNLDGSASTLLLAAPAVEQPRSVHLSDGKLYWASASGRRVQRADVNGSNVETLIASGLSSPHSVVASSVSETVAPILWGDLFATASGPTIHLEWTTLSETNNAGFEVQHQEVGQDAWRLLYFFPGSGTSTEVQSYEIQIPGLPPGQQRFRLKQVSNDGTFTYSPEIEVILPRHRLLVSPPFPNPFGTKAILQVEVDQAQSIDVTLIDVLGREIRQLLRLAASVSTPYDVVIDAQGLAAGLYLVRVRGSTFEETHTVFVQ